MNTLTETDSSDTECVRLKVRVMKINLWTVSFQSCGLFGFAFLFCFIRGHFGSCGDGSMESIVRVTRAPVRGVRPATAGERPSEAGPHRFSLLATQGGEDPSWPA